MNIGTSSQLGKLGFFHCRGNGDILLRHGLRFTNEVDYVSLNSLLRTITRSFQATVYTLTILKNRAPKDFSPGELCELKLILVACKFIVSCAKITDFIIPKVKPKNTDVDLLTRHVEFCTVALIYHIFCRTFQQTGRQGFRGATLTNWRRQL